MTLRDQLNAYKSAKASDDTSASALSEAQAAKIQAAGALATATSAFAHGLAAKGGSAIDTAASPPVLYAANADGTDFTTTTVPSLDDEAEPAGPTSV